MAGTGPWTWNCNGISGGTNAACSAPKYASPQSYSMLCGTSGCSAAAWNQAKFWIWFTLAPAGVPVNPANITAAAGATLNPLWTACKNNKWYAGPTNASVSDGNVTWSIDVNPTNDLYLETYASRWGACIITFSVTYF